MPLCQLTKEEPIPYSIFFLLGTPSARPLLNMGAFALSLTLALSLASILTSAALLPRSLVCANDGTTRAGEYVAHRLAHPISPLTAPSKPPSR